VECLILIFLFLDPPDPLPIGIDIKSPDDIEQMRLTCKMARIILNKVEQMIKVTFECLIGLESGRLGCTRKGDKTTPIYYGRYVSR